MPSTHDLGEPDWRPDARLLDGLTVAAVAVDSSGVPTYWNESALALFVGSGPAGRDDIRTMLFEESERGAADEVMNRVLSGLLWSGDLLMVLSDGGVQPMATAWSPLHHGEDVVGALLLAERKIDPDTQSRRLADRLRKLAGVTSDLLVAEDLATVTEVVTEHMTDAAGATVGSLSLLVDSETLALLGLRGGREGAASRWATYPLSGPTPAAEAVRTGRTLVISGQEAIRGRYPDLELAAEGERTLVCLPLRVTGRAVGVVTLTFPGGRGLDAAELQYLGILADTCAQAVNRIQAVTEAADREAKLRFLAEASAQLSRDLDYETTLRKVADLAVPWFADWCSIALESDGKLRTLSVAHADPSSEHLIVELQNRYPPRPDQPRGGYHVLRTGESDLLPEIPDEILVQAAADEEHLDMLRQLNFRSALAVPLMVRGRAIGVITWVAGEGGRRFGEADQTFGEDLARRAAVAIDNAQLHSQLRDVALHLQRAVLPAELPSLPGWQVAVNYLPAGRTGAGGDFYDVVPLDGGRVALFVGDVMGRGVEAASLMAQMRSAVRTLAAVDPAPEAVMSGLDRVFERLHLEQLVTVVYGVADPVNDQITLINAGHPSPLLLPAAGATEQVGSEKTLILGVGGGERSVVSRPFRVGDAVLLFTDGLVERRDEDLDRGLDRLLTHTDTLRDPAIDEALVRLVELVRDPASDDDVAALVLRRVAV